MSRPGTGVALPRLCPAPYEGADTQGENDGKKNPPLRAGGCVGAWMKRMAGFRVRLNLVQDIGVKAGLSLRRVLDFQGIGSGSFRILGFSRYRIRCFQDVGYGGLLLTQQRCIARFGYASTSRELFHF